VINQRAACGMLGVPGTQAAKHVHPEGKATMGLFTRGRLSRAQAEGAPSAQRQGGPPGQGLTWMLTQSALAQVAADPAVRELLGRARVYEILGPAQQPFGGVDTLPVAVFSAAADLEGAVGREELPPGTSAVLYDPEAWSFTPAAEQRDLPRAMARAAGLAHGQGLPIIIAPALSLTTVLAANSRAPRWRRYLELGLAAAAAEAADEVELQAQSLERDTRTYASFVKAAAEQARAANPRVRLLAGLSTNPPGDRVTGRQLSAAVRATRGLVDGYWLNIPRPGPKCPTCNPPQPGLGIDLLREHA
jgi:hypothetical protein